MSVQFLFKKGFNLPGVQVIVVAVAEVTIQDVEPILTRLFVITLASKPVPVILIDDGLAIY